MTDTGIANIQTVPAASALPPYPAKSPLPFDDRGFFNETKEIFFQEVAPFNDMQKAHALSLNLDHFLKANTALKANDPATVTEREALLTYARFIALPMLKGRDVLDLFQNHFREAFDIGVDPKAKFKSFLIAEFPSFSDRDAFREKITHTLLANESYLTDHPLTSAQTKESLRRVREFLQDYIRVNGMRRADAVKRGRYLLDWFTPEAATPESLRRVKALIDFYEYLKVSSWEWASAEESLVIQEADGTLKVQHGDAVESLDKPDIVRIMKELEDLGIVPIDEEPRVQIEYAPADRLLRQYEQWSKEQYIEEAMRAFAVHDAEARQGEKHFYDLEKMYGAINRGQVAEVLRNVWEIGRSGAVRSALGQSDRYIRYFEHYLEKHNPDEIKQFEQDPATPRFLLEFLKHILIERLKLRDEVAKIAVVVLSNECRKAGETEYARLAYGDLKTGVFKWMDLPR